MFSLFPHPYVVLAVVEEPEAEAEAALMTPKKLRCSRRRRRRRDGKVSFVDKPPKQSHKWLITVKAFETQTYYVRCITKWAEMLTDCICREGWDIKMINCQPWGGATIKCCRHCPKNRISKIIGGIGLDLKIWDKSHFTLQDNLIK